MEDSILRKRRSKKEINMICKEWESSGLSKTKYCKQKNLNASSLVKWIKKFGKTKMDNNSGTNDLKFFSVGKKPNIEFTNSNHVLELTLPNGIFLNVQLPEDIIKSLLRDLLK